MKYKHEQPIDPETFEKAFPDRKLVDQLTNGFGHFQLYSVPSKKAYFDCGSFGGGAQAAKLYRFLSISSALEWEMRIWAEEERSGKGLLLGQFFHHRNYDRTLIEEAVSTLTEVDSTTVQDVDIDLYWAPEPDLYLEYGRFVTGHSSLYRFIPIRDLSDWEKNRIQLNTYLNSRRYRGLSDQHE